MNRDPDPQYFCFLDPDPPQQYADPQIWIYGEKYRPETVKITVAFRPISVFKKVDYFNFIIFKWFSEQC